MSVSVYPGLMLRRLRAEPLPDRVWVRLTPTGYWWTASRLVAHFAMLDGDEG